jgi:hypothetical protein
MAGHGATYARMYVLAVSKPGASSRALETALIVAAREVAENRCDNRAADGRGQSRGGPNFMYVCLRA